MTLKALVEYIKSTALSQPNVRSFGEGSIYDFMNARPSIAYDVVFASQTTHREVERWDYYGFNLFYVSRLDDDLESNRLEVQSIGKEVLDNIIRNVCEELDIEYPTVSYTPFTQRFVDECAGVYCTITFEIPKDVICGEVY